MKVRHLPDTSKRVVGGELEIRERFPNDGIYLDTIKLSTDDRFNLMVYDINSDTLHIRSNLPKNIHTKDDILVLREYLDLVIKEDEK